MGPLIPVWIIGAPAIAIVLLSLLFKGPSSMGGAAPRSLPTTSF